jgi:hypothetical protein
MGDAVSKMVLEKHLQSKGVSSLAKLCLERRQKHCSRFCRGSQQTF